MVDRVEAWQDQHLLFERKDDGILLITINRPEVLNATNSRLHWELSRVWLDIADDDETNVIVVTGLCLGVVKLPDDIVFGRILAALGIALPLGWG